MTLRIIGGKFKGRILKTPKGPSTRPTQGMLREAVFNICQNSIDEARFLDLFAGSGAMGLEAISRGASHATLVESNRMALSCIKQNIEELKTSEQIQILPLKAEKALQILTKQSSLFDIVYIDPPYDTSTNALFDSLPPILAPGAIIFLEERYSQKGQNPPYESSSIQLKDSRRFGIALLHQYRFSGNKGS